MPRDTSRLDEAVTAIRDLAEAAEGNAERLNTNYRVPRTNTSNFVWEDDIFDGVMEKIYIEAHRAFEGDGRAARNYITRTYGQDPVIMAGLESIPSPMRPSPNIQNIHEDQLDDMYTRRLERGINAPYMDYEPEVLDDPPLSSERSQQIIDENFREMYPTPEMRAEFEARRAYRGPPLSREERHAAARRRKRQRREYYSRGDDLPPPSPVGQRSSPEDLTAARNAAAARATEESNRARMLRNAGIRSGLGTLGTAAEIAALGYNTVQEGDPLRGLTRTGAETIEGVGSILRAPAAGAEMLTGHDRSLGTPLGNLSAVGDAITRVASPYRRWQEREARIRENTPDRVTQQREARNEAARRALAPKE